MRSNDLTPAQCDAIADPFSKMLGYLNRLERRMAKQGFPVDDDLYHTTVKARDAMHEASVKTHYFGCKGTTGGTRCLDSGAGIGKLNTCGAKVPRKGPYKT